MKHVPAVNGQAQVQNSNIGSERRKPTTGTKYGSSTRENLAQVTEQGRQGRQAGQAVKDQRQARLRTRGRSKTSKIILVATHWGKQNRPSICGKPDESSYAGSIPVPDNWPRHIARRGLAKYTKVPFEPSRHSSVKLSSFHSNPRHRKIPGQPNISIACQDLFNLTNWSPLQPHGEHQCHGQQQAPIGLLHPPIAEQIAKRSMGLKSRHIIHHDGARLVGRGKQCACSPCDKPIAIGRHYTRYSSEQGSVLSRSPIPFHFEFSSPSFPKESGIAFHLVAPLGIGKTAVSVKICSP